MRCLFLVPVVSAISQTFSRRSTNTARTLATLFSMVAFSVNLGVAHEEPTSNHVETH